jgi:hypothetical protein
MPVPEAACVVQSHYVNGEARHLRHGVQFRVQPSAATIIGTIMAPLRLPVVAANTRIIARYVASCTGTAITPMYCCCVANGDDATSNTPGPADAVRAVTSPLSTPRDSVYMMLEGC